MDTGERDDFIPCPKLSQSEDGFTDSRGLFGTHGLNVCISARSWNGFPFTLLPQNHPAKTKTNFSRSGWIARPSRIFTYWVVVDSRLFCDDRNWPSFRLHRSQLKECRQLRSLYPRNYFRLCLVTIEVVQFMRERGDWLLTKLLSTASHYKCITNGGEGHVKVVSKRWRWKG